MKKLAITFGCMIALAAICFIGCQKDKESSVTIKKYFEVQNGTLVSEKFPSSTSNETIEVQMNEHVLAGGTSMARVESEAEISKVLVGMPNEVGYYELGNACGICDVMNFTLIINQKVESSFEIEVAILDVSGEVSRAWTTTLDLIEAGTGLLQVSLSFNNEKDVDLHLFEPNGTHIYYGSPRSANGGELDVDSNAGCSIDGINNENIFYGEDATIEAGTYRVYVDLWENCDPSIATNYTVTVFYNGTLVHAQEGPNPVSGIFPVGAESNYSDIDNLEPVMTFVIPSNGHKDGKQFAPKPLTNSAKEKMEFAASMR